MSGAYHETFLYRHLEVEAENSESMIVRGNAKTLLAEMDEADTESGNAKPVEAAPSDEAATVA